MRTRGEDDTHEEDFAREAFRHASSSSRDAARERVVVSIRISPEARLFDFRQSSFPKTVLSRCERGFFVFDVLYTRCRPKFDGTNERYRKMD